MSWLSTRGGRLATVAALALAALAVLAVSGTFDACSQQQSTGGRPSQNVSAVRPGDFAWITAQTFARSTRARAANTWGEIRARAFIFNAFQQYGYYPLTQEFIGDAGGVQVHSANIVAVKQGQSARQLIVGAHYDSRGPGQGYVDNATGIGLLLEMAARLKRQPTPYTIVFVAFGAEEKGMLGSRYYAAQMPRRDRKATLGMIDLDAVAGGDHLYVTSQPDAGGWLRDDALTAAKQLGVGLGSSPAQPPLAAGEADAPTDSRPFAQMGIPTATFTSGDFAAGPQVTAGGNSIWHTRRDTVAYVEKRYPGRVRAQLHDLARVLDVLLTSQLEKTP